MNPYTVVLLLSLCLALVPSSALGFDGGADPGEDGPRARASADTYYEASLAERGVSEAELRTAVATGLPTALYVVDGRGGVSYRVTRQGRWKVRIDVAPSRHEKVDAIYDLVLALPLPSGFQSEAWRIPVKVERAGGIAPVVYAGERVRLKRNQPLEASWLPVLEGAPHGLPDLSGTGYEWTFWDTILRYDAGAGSVVRGFGTFAYAADESVTAPDPADPRNAAYLINWVPALDASVPPLTFRLDVHDVDEE